MESINLGDVLSCRRQGMLTQGLAPDPRCKLNISSFITLPHLLNCLICTRNSVSIVLLLWMMGRWHKWQVVDSYQGVGEGTGGGYYLTVCFLYLCFCLFFLHVLSHFSSEQSMIAVVSLSLFIICCLCPRSQVPLSKSYWGIEMAVSVM